MSDADSQQLEANHSEIKEGAAPKLSIDTHYATGQLAESSNALDAAVREYNAALKLDPHHLPSMFRLGVVYAEAKHFDESINAWKNYLKATDYSAAGYGNLGFCYELNGRPDLAEAMYKKGLEKENLNLLCRTNYGLMLAHHNHLPEAMQMWQPVLTPAEMHYNLASVYEAMGHNREAPHRISESHRPRPQVPRRQNPHGATRRARIIATQYAVRVDPGRPTSRPAWHSPRHLSDTYLNQ